MNEQVSQNKQKIKLRWLVFLPLKMFYQNFKMFIFLSIPFAFIMMILSLLLHNNIMCGVDYLQKQTVVACAPLLSWTTLVFQITRLLIIISFIKGWYNYAISKQKINFSELCALDIWNIKIFFILLFIIFINILPSLSYVELMVRNPNPNWLIESMFFAVMFMGFFIPIIAILYYYTIAYAIDKTKLPPLGQISAKAFDNASIIMISTLFMVTCGLFVVAYYFGRVTPLVINLSIAKAITADIVYNIILLAFTALMTNHLFNLRNNLFPKE